MIRSRHFLPLALAVGSALLTADVYASEPVFARRPAISPDGELVVFGYQGDLWSVPAAGGRAVRLTAHDACDRDPVFSPDGSQIAFASDRHGQLDVFVIPTRGGPPERLTYAPTPDIPQDWSADGGEVYFVSRRLFRYPMRSQIQRVPATGGTPLRLTDFFANELALAPDGERFLLTVGENRFGRVGYRGSLQAEIWSWRPGGDPIQLTHNPGYDTDPMWGRGGESVYFRAEDDETRAFNIWRMTPDGARQERLTDFRAEGVRNARISRDGSRIVFEAGTGIWVLDTAPGSRARRLQVDVAADEVENLVSVETVSGDADELAVADDGEELALIVDGEIVLVNGELEGRAVVPVPDPARESGLQWRPGGADTLVFVTDRERNDDVRYRRVALLVSADPEESNLRRARHHEIVYLTPTGVEAHAPRFSPDGERIAYVSGNGDLHVMDADGGADQRIVAHWNTPDFAWSPDGAWIAYAIYDEDYNQDVWIVPADGGKAVNVSQHPDEDGGPVWNRDGTQLAWSSRRFSNQFDVVFCYLRRSDDERTREEWKVWEKTRDDDENEIESADVEPAEAAAAAEREPLRIDFDEIHLRLRRATDLPGDEFVVALHPRGDRFVFSAEVGGERDLYSVDRFGEDQKALTKGDVKPRSASLGPKGETVWFLKGGRPARVPLKGGDVETTSFQARLRRDLRAQRLQILDEGWRALRDRFYDPQLHGVDWEGIRERGVELVSAARHEADFADAMNITLRQLNASHMGYYPPGDRWSDMPGFFGLEFDPEHAGPGLRVLSVVPHGPGDREEQRIAPGDLVLAVEGQPVSLTENFYRTLEDVGAEPVLVRVERDGDELELELVPVDWRELNQRVYEAGVKENRALVEEQSGGRIGYVRIQAMGKPQVEVFERDLYAAAHGKEALVIDVRDNGGGWTTDLLLTILTQPVHAYTIGRGGGIGYPEAERLPLQRWSKPIAVLCNQNSYSNAEIFSHAIQTIGRGPVVGTATGGNVISTGSIRTLDGGRVRLPGRGWYVWNDRQHPERNNLNMEHGGCVPDEIVPQTPVQLQRGEDPQLERAVELMLEAADRERRAPQPKPRRPAAAWD
jgi:tricorn protease